MSLWRVPVGAGYGVWGGPTPGGQRSGQDVSLSKMSAVSGASMGSSASEWGDGNPGMGMTGVHLRVLWGWSVWPLAFHELVAAGECREFDERRFADVDFMPDLLGPRMAGAHFFNRPKVKMRWIGRPLTCRRARSTACLRRSACTTCGCDA